jgi:uracil-DNA glycosylase family 4
MTRPGAIIAQHAKTAQLLGVDAVPIMAFGERPHAANHAELADDATNAASASAAHSGSATADAPLTSLEALRARYIADAPHERFGKPFTNIVFGEGDPNARLMFIGEAPGADEDATGRPFVGKAGELLDKMIVAMGLRRESVYIANVLKTRPPNNETPTIEEAEASAPYLYEQIRLVNPEAIVTLGLPATKLILGVHDTMAKLRGTWGTFERPSRAGRDDGTTYNPREPDHHTVSGEPVGPIAVMPTYHPAFLLRSYTPDNRSKVWSDLTMVMDRLGLEARRRTSR